MVIYGKCSGGLKHPLTVRLAWHPDGKLEPLLYWMSDGTCFQVKSTEECTPLAFLKEGGEGVRFKVRAQITETPELYEASLDNQYEMYVYLADKRFSERNIIDERYGHAGKIYIPVILDVFPDGDYELLYFWVHGARYKVETTVYVEPRGSFQAGGVGIWHKIEARLVGPKDDEDPDPQKSVRRPAALYWELNKWFVSVSAS